MTRLLRAEWLVARGVQYAPREPAAEERFACATQCDELAARFENGESPKHPLTIAGLLRNAARILRGAGSGAETPPQPEMKKVSYHYHTERPYVFTEKGQVTFLQVRDHVRTLLETAGAFQMAKAWSGIKGGYGTWEAMACVDRLVELGEIKEISPPDYAGQYRTFISARYA